MVSEQPAVGADRHELAPSVTDMGPTVLRIALGAQLRASREAAGVTREAAAEAIRGSVTKISRMELGRVRFKDRDVVDLLVLYRKVDPQEREQLLELARRANRPGWWHQYSDLVPDWFETYLGLEQACSVIRTYECQFIPGLLQIREYAQAITELAHDHPEEVHRRVELRLRRQRLLTEPNPPILWAVVDEAALQRPMTGRELHRTQLTHLIEAAERPNISIQVAPFARGAHAAAGGSFTLLRFADQGVPDIVYLEQLTSALYLDRRGDVEHYATVMDRLCAQIEPPDRTPAILDALRREL